MIISAIPFNRVWKKISNKSLRTQSVLKIIEVIERKLGARFLYNSSNIPFGFNDLIDLFELATRLKVKNIITSVSPVYGLPDEPNFHQWRVVCSTSENHTAGGISLENARDALTPALAEAVERYIWLTTTDYFKQPLSGTTAEISKRHSIISPDEFTGFSNTQRQLNALLALEPQAKYLWVKGYSFTHKKEKYLPAQVVSGIHSHRHPKEPLILWPITTGLATGPSEEFALLNGALEVLERDAFMITWLNQLTPPLLDIDHFALSDTSLKKLIEKCRKYKLDVYSTLLPTDAPTYITCSVVLDKTGVGPEVTVGLKAHRSLTSAVKGSLLEALRIRQIVRFRESEQSLSEKKEISELVHVERSQYWGKSGSASKIKFLISGENVSKLSNPWDLDDVEKHWERIKNWCKQFGHECIAIDVGASKKNFTPWKIKMVVMPGMQPMHQTEKFIYLGGERLKKIPAFFGYTPLPEPFTNEPHPFA